MKYIIYLAIIILTLSIIIRVTSNNDPYKKVLATEKDYETVGVYLENYQKTLSSAAMDSLLTKLIVDNMDVYTINMTAGFIQRSNKCEFIPLLEDKCALFMSFPNDTVWYVNYRDDAHRGSNRLMAERRNGICEHVEKMIIECRYRR